jgi:hypothetical protein
MLSMGSRRDPLASDNAHDNEHRLHNARCIDGGLASVHMAATINLELTRWVSALVREATSKGGRSVQHIGRVAAIVWNEVFSLNFA